MAVSAVITQRLVDLDRQLQSAGQGSARRYAKQPRQSWVCRWHRCTAS